jgi:hypothetical protein
MLKQYAIKTYGGEEIRLPAFVTSALKWRRAASFMHGCLRPGRAGVKQWNKMYFDLRSLPQYKYELRVDVSFKEGS